MVKVAEMDCVVCWHHFGTSTQATIHHCNGKTKPGAHMRVLPLCAAHHQVSCPTGEWSTRHGPGRSAGKAAFEEAYGTEDYLMGIVMEELDENL